MSGVCKPAQFLQIKQTKKHIFAAEGYVTILCINIVNNTIRNVECLKILGIHFTKKYCWKEHYIYLKKSLVQRVNLTIFLSSKGSYVYINTHT